MCLAALCSLAALAATGPAQAQPKASKRASARPARPAHAPLIGARPALPPLPPEYLDQERSGIRFAYHPSARDRVRPLIDSAERVRHALRAELNQPVLGTVDIRVAMTDADSSRIMPRVPKLEQGPAAGHSSTTNDGQGAGLQSADTMPAPSLRPARPRWRADASQPVVSFAELGLLVMNLGVGATGDAPDGTEALRHGLAHLALDEATGSQVVPRWFHEGYATRFGDQDSWTRSSSLGWASLTGSLVSVRELDWYLSDRADSDGPGNAQAADFVRFLLASDRAGAFSRLVLQLKSGETYDRAVQRAYHVDERQLELGWRRNVAWRTVYVPVLLGGVVLATLIALGWRLRARWRRRRATRRRAIPRPRPAAIRQPPKLAVTKTAQLTVEVPLAELSHADPPDSGVPKVSHKGAWHTLH